MVCVILNIRNTSNNNYFEMNCEFPAFKLIFSAFFFKFYICVIDLVFVKEN